MTLGRRSCCCPGRVARLPSWLEPLTSGPWAGSRSAEPSRIVPHTCLRKHSPHYLSRYTQASAGAGDPSHVGRSANDSAPSPHPPPDVLPIEGR